MAKTWYCNDTNSLDVTDGSTFNKDMGDAAPGTPVAHLENKVAGGDSDVVYHTYTLLDNVPNLTEWPSGDYIARMYCSAIGGDVTFKIAICRVDSTGTLVSTLGTSGSFNTASTLHSFTHNLASPLTVNAGDRLQVRILTSRAASMGNQSMEITVGQGSGNDSRLETPITLSTTRNRIHVM